MLGNLRSLLLAAIVISNCITWTASRHHYTHNVSRHRSRHRRQGAGLYLSASYVLPGGEGNGWGEWGDVTPCSRTCGGGVASQKRICLEIGPNGEPQCTGGDTKYFSCETQDCPENSLDFRAEQCAQYNNVTFRGKKYRWVPYLKVSKPCELTCMQHGDRFYYRHKEKVIDGTRCNDDSFDVCVDGVCQPVGCDMMLGSNAKEDKCRQCRGNGHNCHTTRKLINTQDLRKGYNDILLIPEGATTIYITEVEPSNNYLALRSKNGTYYLNGDYHIDFPRSMTIAGALWNYERNQQGITAPDKLRSLGPINEPLYLSLLLIDENVGVEYEYSLPIEKAPLPTQRYSWVHGNFSSCSATCGGGIQSRDVTCRSREELEVVDEGLCDDGLKPATNQTCNTQACPPQWVPGNWSRCSKRCGKDGTRSREVRCEKIITNGLPSVVDDKECFDLLGPKPALYESCNVDAACPTWFISPWKPCDKLCGSGQQTRQVVCYQKNNGRINVLSDDECSEEKPLDRQPCELEPCEGVDWMVSEWTGCDTCLATVRSRVAQCVTKDYRVVNSSFCSYHPTPALEEPCDKTKLPACQVQWYATQWSKCSVECGVGKKTRRVFCGKFDGASVMKVDDSNCPKEEKYNDSKPCEVPEEKCPSKWYAAPWSECTKSCGKGLRFRSVVCLRGGKEFSDCPKKSLPDSAGSCNEQPCEALDKKSTPIIDEDYELYNDCIEEEGFEGVNLEADTNFVIDETMFSDQPAFSEGSGYFTSLDLESTFPEIGSGTESTFSTDELLTVEGSGYSSSDTTFVDLINTSETEDVTASTQEETTESGTPTSSVSEETTESGTPTSSVSEETTESGTPASSVSEETTESGTPTSSVSEETTESGTPTSSVSEETTESGTPTSSVSEETTESGTPASSVSEETTESGTPTSSVSEETTESGTPTLSVSEGTTESDTPTSSVSEETTESGIPASSVSEETTESGAPTSSVSEETTESGTPASSVSEETTESGTPTSSVSEETTESGTPTSSVSEETTESGTPTSSVSEETTESGTPTSSVSEETTESGTPTSSVSEETTESGTPTSSVSEETTESGTPASSVSEETTESGTPTSSVSDETTESGTPSSSVSEETTESGTPTSSVSEETTESGTPTSSISEETTESGTATSSVLEETTESGTPTSSVSEETTESGTATSSVSEETTESGTPASSVSEETTESGTPTSSVSEETTESGTPTSSVSEETTESGTSTSSVSEGTTESVTVITGSTEESSTANVFDESEMTRGVTLRNWAVTFVPGYTKRHCRRRNVKCATTKFGCCPDRRTAASGPFDEGCEKVRTCKETRFGCCSDGVSAALGPEEKGCPPSLCAESLFGCCLSDNKTAAGGNDQEGCPPMPPACKLAPYGCCADGETEATGPDFSGCPEHSTSTETVTETETSSETSSVGTEEAVHSTTVSGEDCAGSAFGCCYDNQTAASAPGPAGCPCNATEFGCCPDNHTPAEDAEMKGCPLTCATSRFGCCPDDVTPAHGPDGEGCCLIYPFGCCPDNFKVADGPNFAGCDCHYGRFGCCPDNTTYARGPANEGCGCEHTTHGCCPDRHTPATGPDREGCGCHTYQFGCCPDGVTISKGPGLQGCRCEQSQYGCCGDGETHATGPNLGGCDCSTSKYGCCPDGQTLAEGPKFFGCTDIPENKQVACSLAKDRGSGRDYSVYWYYDMEYGGCSRFWYGGSDGNGNRFATKEECDDVCVQPSPKDACKLPKVKGACVGYNVRWYYDSEREQCSQFVYGGCLGNANNFDTRELCQSQCEPARTKDQCSLPIERGSCAGNFPRWGFNDETQRCEEFIWGGCEGNSNRFGSEAACKQRCDPPGTLQLPDLCTLPAETGECANYEEKWFYDTSEKRCRQFYYGGCGGNENKFNSQIECESRCSEIQTTTTTTTTTVQPQQPGPENSEFCFFETDPGPCTQFETRWSYDARGGRCAPFQYGGCGGNTNNFASEEHCQYYCHFTQDVCQLPMLAGPCNDSIVSWFYDASRDACSQFAYGGCGGNDNRFASRDECESRCRSGRVAEVSTTLAPEPTTLAATNATVAVESRFRGECEVSPTLERCVAPGLVWYLDAARRECVVHFNAESGLTCRNTGTFQTQEACERSCGAFKDINVCLYPLDPGPCRAYLPKYYFDNERRSCQEFVYGGCHGGPNRFSTIAECTEVCKNYIDPCKVQPEPGNCMDRLEKWYYREASDSCEQFVWTGCDGNSNRFETREECEGVCRKQPIFTTTTISTIAVTDHTERAVPDECRTPDSLVPCGENVTVFYYDSSVRSCLAADFGGCRYSNSYRTEEECERRCGAFQDINVCTAQLDPGPCRASIPKIYWDRATGTCKPYAYGGCGGGANRFSSVDECEEVCGETGPAAACLHRVETGAACREPSSRRWYYSAVDGECLAFVYLGCEGNDNNFLNYEDCRTVCKVSRFPETNEVFPDCSRYEAECSALQCSGGLVRVPERDGCERCACAAADPCAPHTARCRTLYCPYGITNTTDADGCQECQCNEDPCAQNRCPPNEQCVPIAYRDPETQEARYSFVCQPENETNEILPDCDRYKAECARLQCEHSVQRTRTAGGCERCECVAAPPDCAARARECDVLHCDHGLQRTTGPDGCEICSCAEDLCGGVRCAGGERCVVVQYRDPIFPQLFKNTTECRLVNKSGSCPTDEWTSPVSVCESKCDDDADCRGDGKCCERGCSRLCVAPALNTAPPPEPPRAPQASPETEPEVNAAEGGKATLRCIFHGNPPPKITWRKGEITIDGSEGRTRVLSDGALEIVSLYRNDTGVYICIAENEFGISQQEIHLQVNAPVSTRILSAPPTLTAGAELSLPCEVDGYPQPENVYWSKDGVRIASGDNIWISGTSVSRLTIRRVTVGDSGVYVCHADNLYSSHESSVQVTVKALTTPAKCTDNPFFADCSLIVRSKFCKHHYYSNFCCKSCLEAGQLSPEEVEMQNDAAFTRRK
ncbi:papilin isoform X5 [Bombyx mandarina]|uniref:Hemolin n=1 Tax=Bombyx mandarina TaxID=7092 RepID=A0A6J2JYX8_BOMMA|nr:papilin isoform X5 [Bombyx mandarina]